MLKELRLHNFKAFGAMQRIPIKPLTLIFGANSAGKSSIIQGLLLAEHANDTGNIDVHRPRLGGDSVDLGGFRQFVHRRDSAQYTKVGISFILKEGRSTGPDNTLSIREVDITVTLGIPDGSVGLAETQPVVTTYELSLNGSDLFCLTRRDGGHFKLEGLNGRHPIFKNVLSPIIHSGFNEVRNRDGEVVDYVEETYDVLSKEQLSPQLLLRCVEHLQSNLSFSVGTLIPSGLTSDWDGRIATMQQLLYPQSAFGKYSRDDPYIDPDGSRNPEQVAFDLVRYRLVGILSTCLKTVSAGVSEVLGRVRYLGPLRSYPPRHLAFLDDRDANWYAGGGHAWETVRRDASVRQAVNAWLGSERLRTPYELKVRRYETADHSDVIEELILLDQRFHTEVSHRDIGIGISQVLPVLVGAYGSENQILAIEQPEIHLHPALQAELGDMFIQSALGERRNTFLLETHSEHLILRIMRRMRDTVRGTLPEGLPPVRPEDVSVLYVQPKEDDSTAVVSELELDEEGQLLDPWPGGFFEEGFRERFS